MIGSQFWDLEDRVLPCLLQPWVVCLTPWASGACGSLTPVSASVGPCKSTEWPNGGTTALGVCDLRVRTPVMGLEATSIQ